MILLNYAELPWLSLKNATIKAPQGYIELH